MNRQKLQQGLMVLALGMGLYGLAQASGTSDSMIVSVTPGGLTYAVTISSPMTQGYQFGTVNMGATTISTVAITLTNSGNVAEYFAMKISNSSPDNWAPTNGTPSTDQFKLMPYLNATQPADATFADALDGSIPGAAATLYGQASTRTAASGTKNLWLRLSMPSGVSVSGAPQTMTLFVNGQAS